MRKLVAATYAINVAQGSNMALTAIVVPLLIGAASYGKYAAIFAVPALGQSTLETFGLLHLSRNERVPGFWPLFWFLALFGAIVSAGVCWSLFGQVAAGWASLLAICLVARSAASAAVYANPRVKYARVTVISEILTLLVYLGCLLGGYRAGLSGYELPLLMIIVAAGASTLYLWMQVHQTMEAPTLSENRSILDWESLRLLFSRSFEDLMLTLIPLFLAANLGLTPAGEFRFVVSVMKVTSKAFPLRYEVVLRGIRTGELDVSGFFRVSIAFVVGGAALAALLYVMRGHLLLSSNTPMWAVALSTGAVVATLSAFPAATMFSSQPLIIAWVGAALTVAAIFLGNSTAFVCLFIATALATFLATMRVLRSMGGGTRRREVVP